MELVFTSVSGKLHVLYCAHQFIQTHELGDSYDKGATQRDRLLIIDWRWTTAATAKEDHAASHSYRQQQQPS